MLPISLFPIYALAAYLLWWFISRGGLVAAWLYSKPGTLTFRHYALLVIGICPIAFELISSLLVIFSVAFGIDPRSRDVR